MKLGGTTEKLLALRGEGRKQMPKGGGVPMVTLVRGSFGRVACIFSPLLPLDSRVFWTKRGLTRVRHLCPQPPLPFLFFPLPASTFLIPLLHVFPGLLLRLSMTALWLSDRHRNLRMSQTHARAYRHHECSYEDASPLYTRVEKRNSCERTNLGN